MYMYGVVKLCSTCLSTSTWCETKLCGSPSDSNTHAQDGAKSSIYEFNAASGSLSHFMRIPTNKTASISHFTWRDVHYLLVSQVTSGSLMLRWNGTMFLSYVDTYTLPRDSAGGQAFDFTALSMTHFKSGGVDFVVAGMFETRQLHHRHTHTHICTYSHMLRLIVRIAWARTPWADTAPRRACYICIKLKHHPWRAESLLQQIYACSDTNICTDACRLQSHTCASTLTDTRLCTLLVAQASTHVASRVLPRACCCNQERRISPSSMAR
jgi:hypothetical protein